MAQGFYFNRPESLDAAIFKYKSIGAMDKFETIDERKNNSELWLEDKNV